MKKDIRNRKDIEKLVNAFYDKIKSDALIGYIFIDVIQTHWDKHLNVMYNFWENILFYTANFDGNPLLVHQELIKKYAINTTHFEQWNKLFVDSVNKLFEGPKAEEIKNRAANIGVVLMKNSLPTL